MESMLHPVMNMQPVFIVGAPRSGTTWLQRMFLEHSGICGGQESHFFATFGPAMRMFTAQEDDPRGVGLPGYISRDEFYDYLRSLWCRVFEGIVSENSGAMILLEKTPSHAFFIPYIRQIFPNAKFIHMIRDSRAVVASLLAAHRDGWGRTWAPENVGDAVKLWRRHVGKALEYKDGVPDESWLDMHYEKLLFDTRAQLQRCFKFMNLECSEEDLERIVQENSMANIGSKSETEVFGVEQQREGFKSEGFYRKGKYDSWREELRITQKLYIAMRTRRLMARLGE